MTTTKTAWKTKKATKNEISKKNSKKDSVSEVVVEKRISDDSETGVSVFTKTTTPKVVVQSEKMQTLEIDQNICKHGIIKSACMIVIGIIILMTFFLALKTYNTVNELSEYVHLIIHP